MFTLSPTGLVLQYEQLSPLALIGRETPDVTVAQSMPGQMFQTGAPGRYGLSALSGDSGTIDGLFETGAAGSTRTILQIQGGPEFPNAYVKVWLDTNNRLLAQVTDQAGVVVATSQVVSPMSSGQLVHFRLAWDCEGMLPPLLQANYGSAYVDVNGTRPDWTIVSQTWTAWRPQTMFVGATPSGSDQFNGVVRRIAVSSLTDPDATQKTWDLWVGVAPTVTSVSIEHLGDLVIGGLDMFSIPPWTTYVVLTGTGAVTLSQSQILAAGGRVGIDVMVPASLTPGIDGTTDCTVLSDGFESNLMACSMPTDVPTISTATIGFNEGLVVTGTYLLSRTPSISSIEIFAPGAVVLTRSDVVTGGGTWTDSSISIPDTLVPGIDNTSTCEATSNAQTTAPHAIVWPAAAPTISSATIGFNEGLTVIGTGLLSTAPASNSVTLTGPGAVVLTALQITTGGGTVGATSISIPAALVPGIDNTTDCEVHANLQDSGTQTCAWPAPAPAISAADLTLVDLTITGSDMSSTSPASNSVVITGDGAVTLSAADITTGGGTFANASIVIPVALIVGVTSSSSAMVHANLQDSNVQAITGP